MAASMARQLVFRDDQFSVASPTTPDHFVASQFAIYLRQFRPGQADSFPQFPEKASGPTAVRAGPLFLPSFGETGRTPTNSPSVRLRVAICLSKISFGRQWILQSLSKPSQTWSGHLDVEAEDVAVRPRGSRSLRRRPRVRAAVVSGEPEGRQCQPIGAHGWRTALRGQDGRRQTQTSRGKPCGCQ
jgi:hypothetical protein